MPRAHVVTTAMLALVIGVLLPASASAGTPRKPSVAAQPQLEIAISDGRTSAAQGDRLTYAIKIRNLGTTDAHGLHISQSLPAGLTLVSADHGGAAGEGGVVWMVDLGPGEESTLDTVGRVGQTPDQLLRLATVACATVTGGRKPLVCATHSDLLPTGTAAAYHSKPTSHRMWYGAGALTLLLAGLAAFIFVRRRLMASDRPRRSSPTAGPAQR